MEPLQQNVPRRSRSRKGAYAVLLMTSMNEAWLVSSDPRKPSWTIRIAPCQYPCVNSLSISKRSFQILGSVRFLEFASFNFDVARATIQSRTSCHTAHLPHRH